MTKWILWLTSWECSRSLGIGERGQACLYSELFLRIHSPGLDPQYPGHNGYSGSRCVIKLLQTILAGDAALKYIMESFAVSYLQ